MKRVIPLQKVVEMMRAGIEKAFDCNIDFYSEDVMVFTFNYCHDDYLSLRVENDMYSLTDVPNVSVHYLPAMAHAFRNAVKCMETFQVTPFTKI